MQGTRIVRMVALGLGFICATAGAVHLAPLAVGPIIVTVDGAQDCTAAALDVARYLRECSPCNPQVWFGTTRALHWTGSRWEGVPGWTHDEAVLTTVPAIHVGPTPQCARVLGDRAESLDDDGFIISVQSNSVMILGKTLRASGFGATAFLEDFCDIRWFMPGELGEDVPYHPTLVLPDADTVHEPAYLHRWPSGRNSDIGSISDWLRRNRFAHRFDFHHNLWVVFAPEKCAADHPELYPILGGRRRIPKPGVKASWQPCLTHPKAVELTMAYARGFFDKRPEAGSISVAINDGGGYCECERCLEMVDTTQPPEGQRSKWFFQYANEVARRVATEFPGKRVGYLGYGQCKLIPPGLKLEPNLICFLVTPSWNLVLDGGRKAFDEAVANTTSYAPHFALYNWYYGVGTVVPAVYPPAVKYYLHEGHKRGAIGSYTESYYNWGLDGIKYWVYARLLWDPALDIRELWREAITRFYRRAAEPMTAYFADAEACIYGPGNTVTDEEGRARVSIGCFRRAEHLQTFTPEVIQRLRSHLDQAEKLARDPIVKRRLAYVSQAFGVTEIAARHYWASRRANELLDSNAPIEAVIASLRAAARPDADLDLYYQWVLKGDRYQVRRPTDTIFAPMAKAQARLAGLMSQQIADLVSAHPSPTARDAGLDTVRKSVEKLVGPDPDLQRLMARLYSNASRIAFARRVEAAPTMDGEAGDACWQGAEVYSGFWVNSTGAPASYKTTCRFVFDDRYLYCLFQCYQDVDKILIVSSARDGRVWREDSVEFLLNRPDTTDPKHYFQIMTNSAGNIFDILDGDAAFNMDAKVATSIQKDHYVLEWALPWEEMQFDPKEDSPLRMNVVRNAFEHARARTNTQTELSNWYLTPGGNRDLVARGWLFLVD
ncbi:MAG: DUF4838 domain-containing protein [Lentisphaerae bacterium]|nr:DUF4838 domain-containing protein [Lentisphaerota bacterium]MBT5610089.1 DUF4838 domain-containing protein [Lentisphaerota bacterium]MBT7061638.1 DUF4838 domain-containing protein [Lentisphaerota bacterium]MBT7841099.1 DUF4838 domain-containing protein [Lentisphaerota bacterium]